jgi:glycosyltransferase involved in cell wall biosynthesis
MPNYNHARFIPQSLQALLDQSRPALEILFIDDASTDHSLNVVRAYADRHPSIKVIENPVNRGVNYNLVRALELARGDYVVGAACDDQVLPGFFEKSLTLLARHPQAGLCSSRTRMMDENGTDLGVLPGMDVSAGPSFIPPEKARRIIRSFGNWMQGNTTIYQRDALIKAGGFRPDLHSFSDNFVSQVLALTHGACFIPEPLGAWRRMNATYSVQCRSDPEIEREIVRTAVSLMETTYRDIFPAGYPRLWAREIAFERARFRRGRSGAIQVDQVRTNGCAARSQLTPRARHVAACARGLATLCYLVMKHRPVQAIRRQILRAFPRNDLRLIG